MSGSAEDRYRQGVDRWMERDLDGAVELLADAIEVSAGPEEDPWWFSTTRALAQIALERDDPALAELHLARLQGTLVGDAQTLALRARLALLRGDPALAEESVGRAVLLLLHDREREIGPLMNGAIALASCAEVLVELGYGDEVARVVAQAQERTARAGIHDEVLSRWLSLSAAGSARLRADPGLAEIELAGVEVGAGDDFGARVARERARLAWDAGDRVAAEEWYERAQRDAEAHNHPALARLLAEERPRGPVAMQQAALPVDRWLERAMGGADLPDPPDDDGPDYAVVVTLVLGPDGDEPARALDATIEALLDQIPEHGYLDGALTDGNVYELFLEGDDPEALWDAIRPTLLAATPPRGSQVTIRHLDGSWRIEPIADPL